MTSDAQLLEAWRNGDRDQGDELLRRHFDAIFGFFSRKVSGDVSDLVQKTFLACVEGRDRFRGEASVRTYLFAVARNQLYEHLRQRARDERLDFGVSSLHDLGTSPSQVVARRADAGVLAEALRRIPLDAQILIELRFWEELTGPELSRVLDMPEGTVRTRLRKALSDLRDQVVELQGTAARTWVGPDAFEQWARSLRPYDAIE